MILDRDTILAVSALIMIVLGAILVAAQANGRIGAWATCWGLGNVAFGLSNINRALVGTVPATLLSSGENIVGIVGYALMVQGARLLAGRKPRWAVLAVLVLLMALPFTVLNLPEDRPIRVTINNAVFIIGDLWVVFEALRLARSERLSTSWIMAGLFAVTVPFSFYRLGVAVTTLAGTNTLAHGRLGAWMTALLAAFWSLRGAVPALIIAERSTQKLARLATRDALTGALNRVGLEQLRETLRGQTALVMIDMDHFKPLNDRYGHAQGDAVLRLLADAAHARLRGREAFVRLGGDEFLVVLPGGTDVAATQAAQAIRADFAAAVTPLGFAAPSPSISIGIATGDLGQESLEALLSQADTALYRAKRGGRDRIELRPLAA